MRTPLIGGAYASESIIASAQRAVNLYAEKNPAESQPPVPVTQYPTPGLILLGSPPAVEGNRCVWTASNGDLYEVVGPNVYYIDQAFVYHLLGSIPDQTTPVSMQDNGLVIVLVDGTATGYAIDITPVGGVVPRTFGTITDPNFLGSSFVDYIDTFFVFNQIGTYFLYISLSEVTFSMLTQTSIGTGTITAGGTLYTDGTYFGVPLTGGIGFGATADITVQSGVVTGVTIDTGGQLYHVGDILSATTASIGGTGSGFQYTVDTFAPAFDPLDIAAKSGSPDPIQRIMVCHREVWPIGSLTSEVWVDTGAADFTLQPLPGAFIEHGCIAKFSVAKWDNSVFWLSQDRQGRAVVVQTVGFGVQEISTHGIVTILQGLQVINDAIGYFFQIKGHVFYVITFPTADVTYAVDIQTKQWFQWASIDNNGALHRHRSNGAAFAYSKNIVADWQNGSLYELSGKAYTDNGMAIPRIRSFPHMVDDLERITYNDVIADIQVGTDDGTIDGTTPDNPPLISLRWSDDRGQTYGNSVTRSLGSAGEYDTSVKWARTGMARDRVFEFSWSIPAEVTFNGATFRPIKHGS